MTEPEAAAPDAPLERPLLSVVRGEPSPEELAALVAVISARAAAAGEPDAPARPAWGAPVLRGPLPHGPGAWRSSGLPH